MTLRNTERAWMKVHAENAGGLQGSATFFLAAAAAAKQLQQGKLTRVGLMGLCAQGIF